MNPQEIPLASFRMPKWATYIHRSLKDSQVVGIKERGDLIAFCIYREERREDFSGVWISALEVHPSFRKRGMATCLLNYVLALYPKSNYGLICGLRSTAHSLYLKMGFMVRARQASGSITYVKYAE